MVRVTHSRVWDRSWAPRPALTWLTIGILTVVVFVGCRRGVPSIDTDPRPVTSDGTISGTVRGPQSAGAIEGRMVEVINIATNERQRVTTNNAGGFTVKVKPGKYRVEFSLRGGERLLKQPGVMNVNRSDVDAHADFVLGGRESRPRGSGSRTNASLGSPIG
jgi:Carboxypeptidase regulatory-like domain